MLFIVIILLLILFRSYRLYQHFFSPRSVNPAGKHVLITGCDTDFGRILATELGKQNLNILAAVYDAENQVLLQSELSLRATVLCLNVTQPIRTDAAYKLVREKTNTLYALVNNASVDQNG